MASFLLRLRFRLNSVVASRGEEELNDLRGAPIVASKYAHIQARSCLFVGCEILCFLLTKTEDLMSKNCESDEFISPYGRFLSLLHFIWGWDSKSAGGIDNSGECE